MPEPTGSENSNTNNQNDNAGGNAGAGASGDGSGSQGGSQGGQGTQDARLTAEAAKWRTQLRAKEQEFNTLKTQFEELKAKVDASPGAGSNADNSKIATLERSLGDLRTQLATERSAREKAEATSKAEKLDGALRKVAGEMKLLNAEDAMIVARTKGRAKIADDGKPVFVVTENGDEREVEISAESVKQFKLVGENFFPSEGVGGAGSRGSARQSNASGVDMERAKTDIKYYQANRDAVIAEQKRLAAG